MRKFLRWTGRLVLVLVLLGAGVYAWAYWYTELALARRIELPRIALEVDGSAAQVERGRHLAVTRGCSGCHGEGLVGRVLIDSPAFGRIVASNITPAGMGRHYDVATLEHAIRHAVAFDGTPLVFMPSADFIGLSDEDTAALIAYVQSVPAVEDEMPATQIGPVARVLFTTGRLPLLPATTLAHEQTGPAQTPEEAATPEFGRYLAQSCTGCHGNELAGGRIPGTPPGIPAARNITPAALGSWTLADFVRAMREGRRPDGSEIDPFMPWQAFATMSDVELEALWVYLQTVPAKQGKT